MPGPLVFRDLGARSGRCASCGADAQLQVTESHYRRTWRALRVDPHRSRTATCSVCHETYPIRSTDADPAAAARREGPPAPRGKHRAGRDWFYAERRVG